MTESTASHQIKNLHRKHGQGHTLKDFAVDLGANGTTAEKTLVNAWFQNKRPEPVPKDSPKKAVVAPEPPKKVTGGKKR